MANPDAAFGLKPVRRSHGEGAPTFGTYSIADGYATTIYRGDPVRSVGNGRDIQLGTAGGDLLGVFSGCSYTRSDGMPIFGMSWPASTAIKAGTSVEAYVYDDPDMIFAVQADGAVNAADINSKADLVAATGDAGTEQSRWELDSSTIGVGGSIQVKILGLAPDYNTNEVKNAYGNFAVVHVLITEHENRGATVAV